MDAALPSRGIAKPLPMDALPPDRRTEMAELDAAVQETEGPAPTMYVAEESAQSASNPDPPPYTDDDKREFVRAVLANKPYEKTYALFGDVRATFVDRAPLGGARILKELEADTGGNRLPRLTYDSGPNRRLDEERWYCRYLLALTLRKVVTKTAKVDYPAPAEGALFDRVMELTKLPRPLFEGLYAAVLQFDELTAALIEKATSPDFWTTGGSPSR